MAGAAITHVYYAEWEMFAVTLILFTLAALVAFIRKPVNGN
jgi:hypothetical protein